MLRGCTAVRARRAHQEPRRPVRSIQFVRRSVQKEARPTAEEPSDRSVERLRGWVHRRFPAGHIHQFQIAQALAIVGTVATVGRCGSAHPDHAGKTHRDVDKNDDTRYVYISYYFTTIVMSCALTCGFNR